jgi:hypothetical protein
MCLSDRGQIDRPRCTKCQGTCRCTRFQRDMYFNVLRPTIHYNKPSEFKHAKTATNTGDSSRQRIERIGIIEQRRWIFPWSQQSTLYETKREAPSTEEKVNLIAAHQPSFFSVFPSERPVGQIPPLSTPTKYVCQLGPNKYWIMYGSRSFGVALRVRRGFWDEVISGPTGHFAALCPLDLPDACDVHELPRPSTDHRAVRNWMRSSCTRH